MQPTLEQRLAEIRTGLKELTDIQSQLQKNASESKSDIQSAFSRQLEALRTREIHLLSQVETLLQVKQDHVKLQAEGLQRELGALEALLEYAGSTGTTVSLEEVENIMKRFQQFELSHDEDALLSFEGDTKQLKKAILSFGYVNGKRPRMANDEDEKAMANEIIGAFEQFAGRQMWLCKVKKSADGSEDGRPRMVYPIFSEKGECASWLFKGDSDCGSSSCGSASSSDCEDSFVMVPEGPVNTQERFSAHFARILSSPNIHWVRPASKTANVGVSPHQQRKSYSFYRPAGTTKDWVRASSAPAQGPDPMETTPTNTCSPSQAPAKQIEIEDLADLVCVQDSPSGAPSPCSPKGHQDEEKTTPCCSTPVANQYWVKTSASPSVSDVCKGNETCNTFADCMCDDNCADTVKRGSIFSGIPESSKNKWLVKTPPAEPETSRAEESNEPINAPDEEMPKAEFVKEWLASEVSPGDETSMDSAMSSMLSGFMKWQLEENQSWVKNPASTITTASSSQQQPNEPNPVNEWLLKKSDESATDNKLSVGEKQHSDWLVPKSLPAGLPAVGQPPCDSAVWLVKKCPGNLKEDGIQEKWLKSDVQRMHYQPAKPTGFPYFTAPMDPNQWLKQ